MHNEILKTGAKCWDSEFVFRQQVSDSFSNQYFSIWLLLDNLIIRIWDEMGILAFIQLVPLMSCDTSTEESEVIYIQNRQAAELRNIRTDGSGGQTVVWLHFCL